MPRRGVFTGKLVSWGAMKGWTVANCDAGAVVRGLPGRNHYSDTAEQQEHTRVQREVHDRTGKSGCSGVVWQAVLFPNAADARL